MSFIAVAVTAAVVIGGAVIKNQAQGKAAKRQQQALGSLEGLDIDELNSLASDTDIEKFKKQFQVQADNDPTYAALRNKGGAGILRALNEDANGQTNADLALKQMSEDLKKEGPVTQGFIDDLLSRAKADLDAGATLPPEFQAELVKAGLEGAGTKGLSIEGRGSAGTDVRRLLGSEGLALKGAREANARTNITAAEALRERRARVLEGLATLDNNLRGAKVIRAGGAAAIGSAAVPSIGLTGQDDVNMSIQNTNLANQVKLGIGNIKAQKALNDGAMYSSILSAVGGAAGGVVNGAPMGGVGAPGGSAMPAGGVFSGIGSWIGGLFPSNKAAPTYGAGGMAY